MNGASNCDYNRIQKCIRINNQKSFLHIAMFRSFVVNKRRDFEQINSPIKLVLQLRLHLLKYTIQFVYFQKDYTRKKTNFHIEFIYFLYSCIKQNKRELLKIFLNGTRIFINKKI